jgi:hypothetical protein
MEDAKRRGLWVPTDISRAYLPCLAVSMSEAFGAGPADLGDAIAAGGTIAVDFASPAARGPNLLAGIARLIRANSVYTSVVARAMLIAITVADANRFARPLAADRFIDAIGVLSALGGLTVALQASGPLGTIRMLETVSDLAVRISAGILGRTLSALLAVP